MHGSDLKDEHRSCFGAALTSKCDAQLLWGSRIAVTYQRADGARISCREGFRANERAAASPGRNEHLRAVLAYCSKLSGALERDCLAAGPVYALQAIHQGAIKMKDAAGGKPTPAEIWHQRLTKSVPALYFWSGAALFGFVVNLQQGLQIP